MVERVSGQLHVEVHVTLHPGLRVRGIVVDPAGHSVPDGELALTVATGPFVLPPPRYLDLAWTTVGADGTFAFPPVRQGAFVEIVREDPARVGGRRVLEVRGRVRLEARVVEGPEERVVVHAVDQDGRRVDEFHSYVRAAQGLILAAVYDRTWPSTSTGCRPARRSTSWPSRPTGAGASERSRAARRASASCRTWRPCR